MHQLRQLHAEPAEEAGFRHAFYHNHHARDKDNGSPINAGRAFFRAACRIPEADGENAPEVEGFCDCVHASHREAEDACQSQDAACQCYMVPFNLVHHNQDEHSNK